MKFKLLIALVAAMLPAFILAQADDAAMKDAAQTLYKIQKLNILKYVTPLLMKKTQINDILLSMERCRAKGTEIKKLDAIELKKLDGDIQKAIDSAINDGKYPDRDLQKKVITTQDALLLRRKIASNEMVDMLFDTCKKTLNDGQIAVMKNLVDPSFMEGSTKASSLPDEQKIKLYIRQIFLDDTTYEVLKELAKHAE